MLLTVDMANSANTALAFALDDFVITPMPMQETVVIGETEVQLEMEDYVNHGLWVDIEDTEADESVYAFPGSLFNDGSLFGITEASTGSPIAVKIPVNVTKAGKYDVEMISNYLSGSWMSGIDVQTADRQLCLQNTAAYRTADLSAPAEGSTAPTYFDGNYPAGKFNGKVFLNAGQQDIVVRLQPRTADNRVCAKVDYLKLTPAEVAPVALSKTEATVIALDAYADAFDTKPAIMTSESAPGNLASGGTYLQWDTGARTHDLIGDILVSVPQTGIYNIAMVATNVGGSAPALYVDGVKASLTVSNVFENKNEAGLYPYFANAHFGGRNVTGSLFLTEGEHWISVGGTRRTITENGKTFQDVAICMDDLTITPDLAPAFSVAAEGASTMQFEDYVNYTFLNRVSTIKGNIKEYAKGTVLELAERPAADGIYLDIPLTVAEDGWYNMEAILSESKGTWTSHDTIYIDGKEILKNTLDYSVEDISKDAEGNFDYVSKDYAMHRFSTNCYLEAGEHDLTFYAKKRSQHVAGDAAQEENAAMGITNVCTMIDSLTLTRLKDNAAIDGNSVAVSVYYDEVYEGKIITALYAGKQMVGISTGDIANGWANTTASFTQIPDTVKVFVWNDLNIFAPLVEEKVFELN